MALEVPVFSLEDQVKKTSETVQKLAESLQRSEEKLAESLQRSEEKLAERVAESHQRMEEGFLKLDQSVNNLVGWSSNFDRSLEDTLTKVVCDYSGGQTIDSLKEFKDHLGKSIVEFDGAVGDGVIDGHPVLVLIESKHHVRMVDVNLAACNTERERNDCLPTRAERYTEAYNGLVEAWEDNATIQKHKNRLGRQSDAIKKLREQETELLFAVGGRYFPSNVQTYCKKAGYLCIVPNGDGFEIMK
jgi:hypothetical protein